MISTRLARRFCFPSIIVALFAATLLRSRTSDYGAKAPKPIVVMADDVNGRVIYKIDSRPTTDLLLSLSKLEERRGPKCPVTVLINPHLPIEQIWTIDGTAGKAQLTNLRFFIFFRETGKMTEIRRMPAVTFQWSQPQSNDRNRTCSRVPGHLVPGQKTEWRSPRFTSTWSRSPAVQEENGANWLKR